MGSSVVLVNLFALQGKIETYSTAATATGILNQKKKKYRFMKKVGFNNMFEYMG